MKIKKVVLFNVIFITLLISCDQKEKSYKEKMVDGIRIINNLKPKWGIERLMQYKINNK